MNAGTDVLNLQMDGKPVTGQDSLYASAVLDAPTGEVILKLVNAGSRSEKVQIEFSGLKKRQLVSGSCTYLQSDDWKAKNSTGAGGYCSTYSSGGGGFPFSEPGASAPFVRSLSFADKYSIKINSHLVTYLIM